MILSWSELIRGAGRADLLTLERSAFSSGVGRFCSGLSFVGFAVWCSGFGVRSQSATGGTELAGKMMLRHDFLQTGTAKLATRAPNT